MPFTASHTAIILPLLKKRIFSVSGLIMGSMVPDFEFFIRMEANIIHGHSFWGMFWLNIPTAILCISLYHLVVRNQLILNLPTYFKKRFQPFLEFNWISYLKSNSIKVIYSILLGNLSHLFLDSFTHYNGFVVTKIAFLNTEYWQIPLYHILQYGFSVVGALAILKFISKMPEYQMINTVSNLRKISYWCSVTLITVAFFVLRYDIEDYHDFGARVVFICTGFLIGLVSVSITYNLLQQKGIVALPKRY